MNKDQALALVMQARMSDEVVHFDGGVIAAAAEDMYIISGDTLGTRMAHTIDDAVFYVQQASTLRLNTTSTTYKAWIATHAAKRG